MRWPASRRGLQSASSRQSKPPPSGGGGVHFVLDDTSCRHLDGSYSVFGKIVEGLDAIHKVSGGTRIRSMTMIAKRDHDYTPKTISK